MFLFYFLLPKHVVQRRRHDYTVLFFCPAILHEYIGYFPSHSMVRQLRGTPKLGLLDWATTVFPLMHCNCIFFFLVFLLNVMDLISFLHKYTDMNILFNFLGMKNTFS